MSYLAMKDENDYDSVNKPKHYTTHPSGIECIEITRHMGYNLGNVIKYVWRADLKDNAIEDLEKALWYLSDEIAKRKKEPKVEQGTINTLLANPGSKNLLSPGLFTSS